MKLAINDNLHLIVDIEPFAVAWANRNGSGLVPARKLDMRYSDYEPELTFLKIDNGKITCEGHDVTALVGAVVDPITWGNYFVDMRMIDSDLLHSIKEFLQNNTIKEV